jgi:WS/DGAT/MGAT family acyltransferase
MHGGAFSIVEGEIPFEDIIEHFESRLHLVPRYRQRLVYVPFNMAHPKWVDDPQFDIRNHVILETVPSTMSVDDAIDHALVLAEPLMDRDKPLWKTFVIEGVPDRTILFQLGHHSMIDGASGIDISLVVFDLQPQGAQYPPPAEPWRPRPTPSTAQLMTEAVQENVENLTKSALFNPSRLAQNSNLLERGAGIMQRMLTQPVMTAPWNAGMVAPRRTLTRKRYPFAQFRDIRRTFGGTINDVVLTIVSEGAARYLETHKEPVSNQYLRIMCPVNVRREDEAGVLGNRVSGIFPRLPAESMDILDRLRYVQGETTSIKSNQEAHTLELMNEFAPSIPPVAMLPTLLVGTAFDPTALAARIPPPVAPKSGYRPPMYGFNFTCTNVPGVQTAQYLLGHEILDTYGLLMLGGNLGFGVVVGSYNRNLYFSLASDPRLMPDPEFMLEVIDDAFQELMEATGTGNAVVS